MPFCVDFFKTTVDALLALVSAAMTLVASLVHPMPGQPQSVSSSPAIALISYVAGQDTADLAARLRDADPRTRTIAALKDSNSEVRQQAVFALGQIR